MTTGRGNSPGRGRGRGRGSRQDRRRQQSAAGRRLFRHEQDQIVAIFALLSRDARLQLVQLLQGLLGETSSGPGNVPPTGGSEEPPNDADTGPSPSKSPRRRVRIYERDIIRDLPGVREFGAMNSKDRADHADINQLMSVASGVISRARKQGHTDDSIRQFILENSQNIGVLRGSYPNPPRVEAGSEDAEASNVAAEERNAQGGTADASTELALTPTKLGSPLVKGVRWGSVPNTPEESGAMETEEEETEESDRSKPKRKRKKSSEPVIFKTNESDKSHKPPPGSGDPGMGGGTALTV